MCEEQEEGSLPDVAVLFGGASEELGRRVPDRNWTCTPPCVTHCGLRHWPQGQLAIACEPCVYRDPTKGFLHPSPLRLSQFCELDCF